jgi:iron(III) transport system permease protein
MTTILICVDADQGLCQAGPAVTMPSSTQLSRWSLFPTFFKLPMPRWLAFAFLFLLALLLTLPVLSLGASWLQFDAAARDVLHQMAQTVLPEYALTTVVLCLCVALGVALVGMGTASAVTLFDFPGRRVFEWALLLPLAMPAYVVAYAYTDFLQFSGPLQVGLREAFDLRGRVFPEIRNTPGAVWVFTFSLYPYVYLLARTALSERASQLMEAARLLGAPLSRRIREVALPLARPAVAAGVALALMETLADFGVASYFGIQTFTAGIYKAWLSMDNRAAAPAAPATAAAPPGPAAWWRVARPPAACPSTARPCRCRR